MKKSRFLFAALALVFGFNVQAQSFRLSPNSTFTIDGTSNVHDWTAEVKEVSATTTVTDGSIEAMRIVFKVKSMDSGDSMMNSRMQSSMDADDYPEIVFVLKSFTLNGNRATLNGDLTIHGQRRNINVQASYQKLADGSIKLTGSQPVLFTQHGMSPPSFMFGAMKVADEVKVSFNVILTR